VRNLSFSLTGVSVAISYILSLMFYTFFVF